MQVEDIHTVRLQLFQTLGHGTEQLGPRVRTLVRRIAFRRKDEFAILVTGLSSEALLLARAVGPGGVDLVISSRLERIDASFEVVKGENFGMLSSFVNRQMLFDIQRALNRRYTLMPLHPRDQRSSVEGPR